MAKQRLKDTATGEDKKYPIKDNTLGAITKSGIQGGMKSSSFAYNPEALPGGESTYDDEGLAPNSFNDIAQNRIEQQAIGTKLFNTVVGGAISGVGTMVESLGYLFDINTYKSVLGEADLTAQQNFASKFISGIGRGISDFTEEQMPIYEDQVASDAYIKQFASFSTWKGIVDSAIGFTGLGGVVSKGIKVFTKGAVKGLTKAGKMTRAAQVASKGNRAMLYNNKLMNQFSKLERTSAYARKMQMTNPKLVQNLGAASTSLFSKMAESRIEGYEAYTDAKLKYSKLVDKGLISNKEAEIAANKAANKAFDMSMWTAALDFGIMKGFFRGRKFTSEILEAPTKRKFYANMIKEAPKEGLEEMIQTAGAQEGMEYSLNYIKDKLDSDKELAQLREMGFNTSNVPKSFSQRMGMYMASNDAIKAAMVGMISGPMQQAIINGATGNKEFKAMQEEYEEQQSLFESNKALFNNSNMLAKKAKELTQQEDFLNFASLVDDEELFKIAESVAFNQIAVEHIQKNQQAVLRETAKAAGRDDLVKQLGKIEKQVMKSSMYANSNEMLALAQTIDHRKETLDLFKKRAADPNLPEDKRKQYEEQIPEYEQSISELQNEFDEKASNEYQRPLFAKQVEITDMLKVLEKAGTISDITKLEKLKNKYKDEPFVVEAITGRIDIIRGENEKRIKEKKSKAEKKKEKGTTSVSIKYKRNKHGVEIMDRDSAKSLVKKKAEEEFKKAKLDLTEDLLKEFQAKYISALDNSKTSADAGQVSPTAAIGTYIAEKSKKPQKPNKTTPDNTTLNKNGIPIQSEKEVQVSLNKTLKDAMTKKGVTMDDSDLQSLVDHYYEIIEDVTDVIELGKVIVAKVNNLVDAKVAQISDPDNVSTNPENDEVGFSKEILNLGAEFLNELSKDTVMQEEPVRDAMPSLEDNRKRSDLFYGLYTALVNSGKITEDMDDNQALSVLLDALSASGPNGPKAVQTYFNAIKGFYNFTLNTNATLRPEEYFGETIVPLVPIDMPTDESNNTIIDTKLRYVTRKSNSDELMEIFMDEKWVNLDSKNSTPAISFAYLSKDWMFEVNEADKQVERADVDKNINGNPVLNPNKFNSGHPITMSIDEDYDLDITITGGQRVNWKEFRADHKKDVDTWRDKYNLDADETLADYVPIKIETEEDGLVAYLHTPSWINKINVEKQIEKNKALLRKIRADVLNYPGPVKTTVKEKVLEAVTTEDGRVKYIGFVMNRADGQNSMQSVSEVLPDLQLHIVRRKKDVVKAPKKGIILNAGALGNYGPDISFVLVPLGKKDGKDVYHAEPLWKNKITANQARGLRQAIEIYIRQDTSINQDLYDEYKKQDIDLLETEHLSDVISSIVYMYNQKKIGLPFEKYMQERMNAGKTKYGFIEFQGGQIKFAASEDVSSEFKGKPTKDTTDNLDFLEQHILPEMLFNVDFTKLEEEAFVFDKYTFVEVDADKKIQKAPDIYKEFVRQNVSTQLRSELQADGSYTYTYQNIITFNPPLAAEEESTAEEKEILNTLGYSSSDILLMTLEEKMKIINEKIKAEAEIVVTESDTTDRESELAASKEAQKIYSKLQQSTTFENASIEELFTTFLNGTASLEDTIRTLNTVYESLKHSKGAVLPNNKNYC